MGFYLNKNFLMKQQYVDSTKVGVITIYIVKIVHFL